MTLNKKQLKKLPFYLSLILLTLGASSILGFLSFGGMYALWPVVPLAVGALVLSVAYEYEIYYQNIKGALNKLRPKFLDRQVSNQFLLDHFPDIQEASCPNFFKDYQAQLKLLHKFEHKRLDESSLKQKKQVEKTLKDMEKWFALQFFSKKTSVKATAYEDALHEWLDEHKHTGKYHRRRTLLNGAWIFSSFTGLLMMLGSTFLLVEAFTAIPLLASIPFAILPAIILPMAVVSGLAYGLLTYNAVTDMIANDALRKWCRTLWHDFKTHGIGPRTVFMAGLAALLVVLAVTLTVCTAGTWWTIAKHTRPLFPWMAKIPAGVMALIGADGIVFNLVNTKASWDMIRDALGLSGHTHKQGQSTSAPGFVARVKRFFNALSQKENLVQILNPFRLLLIVTITPIRLVLFSGHLVSMGVGDDRVPGLPAIVGAALSTVSEVFEDMHYFFDVVPGGHHHGHSVKDLLKDRHSGHDHSHDNDLPTLCVKWFFSPLYLLAALWDAGFSQFNRKTPCDLLIRNNNPSKDECENFERSQYILTQDGLWFYQLGTNQKEGQLKQIEVSQKKLEKLHKLFKGDIKELSHEDLVKIRAITAHRHNRSVLSLSGAWKKQHGMAAKQTVTIDPANEKIKMSDEWKREHAIYRIERHKQKQLHSAWIGRSIARTKKEKLNNLQTELRKPDAVASKLLAEEDSTQYSKHRFFASSGKTSTEQFVAGLAERVGVASAA